MVIFAKNALSEAKNAIFFPFAYIISESLPRFFFFLVSSVIGRGTFEQKIP